MPQPTTRRGRYLVFLARYRKRRDRCNKRKRRGGVKGHQQQNRERDVSGLPMMAVKSYPHVVKWFNSNRASKVTFTYLPPNATRRAPLWPIVGEPEYVALKRKFHGWQVGVVHRRMKRYPHVRRLPLLFPSVVGGA